MLIADLSDPSRSRVRNPTNLLSAPRLGASSRWIGGYSAQRRSGLPTMVPGVRSTVSTGRQPVSPAVRPMASVTSRGSDRRHPREYRVGLSPAEMEPERNRSVT